MNWRKAGAGALLVFLICVGLMSSAGAAGDVSLDQSNFPDAGFLAVAQGFDENNDGVLSSGELAAVTQIICNNDGITSLEGIEYFTSLRWLECTGNDLAALDVSGNELLSALYCANNALTELDVSHNPSLVWLDCSHNALTALDVASNLLLEELDCNNNALAVLNVSANTQLYWLDCSNNALTALDVSGNTLLEAIACDFQAVNAGVYIENGTYKLDLAALVGADNLGNVSGLSYDESGVAGVSAVPGEVSYSYATGYNSETMEVSVSITTLPGDINGDGKIRTTDARIILQYLVGMDVTYSGNLDVNGDGKIRTTDARAVLQYLVGMDVTLH